MTTAEFLAERRRLNRPVEDTGGHTGGLIPTEGVEDEGVQFMEAPAEAPPAVRAGRPVRGEEQDTEDSQETVQSDVAGDDADADRMLFRPRILNTFGSPLKGCFVAVSQDDGQAGAWTNDSGVAEVLIVRPKRTEKGAQESEEIAKGAEGRLVAPPAQAPTPGRTPHVNVRVSRGGDVLKTTRLYFRDVPENADDAHYNGTRVIAETGADFSSYDVVIDTGRPQD